MVMRSRVYRFMYYELQVTTYRVSRDVVKGIEAICVIWVRRKGLYQ
jgi:hypothetical protein